MPIDDSARGAGKKSSGGKKAAGGASAKKPMPEGLWTKCPKCEQIIYNKELVNNKWVCPKCGSGLRMSARNRIALLVEPESFKELEEGLSPRDVLQFSDSQPYKTRLADNQKKTNEKDAVVIGEAMMGPVRLALGVMNFNFMGGSMGAVVGEKITRAIEYAVEKELPLLIVSSSGGARMQEGILSLFQMAKTSAALARLSEARLPFISMLTDPTTGGVTASFAMLGDIIAAEPKSLVAFAGPRVIEQTIRQTLPQGFQESEFLLKHGMVDLVADRGHIKDELIKLFKLFMDARARSKPPRA